MSSASFCIQRSSGSGGNVAPSNEISRAYALGISTIAVMDSPLRFGVLTDNKWENGKTLTVAFFGGSPSLQSRTLLYAYEWMNHANIKFERVEGRYGDIRVVFTGDGGVSSSYVGTGCRKANSWEHTMQLGIDDSSSSEDIRRIVLHEFGHALGCVHEHSQPNANILWNRQAVLDAHKNTWDAATVDANIFKKYDSSQVQASSFDRYSIMLYPIPASWTYGTFSSRWNNTLSSMDKAFIGKIYPFNSIKNPITTPNPVSPPVASNLLLEGSYYNIINTATNTYLDVSGYNNYTVQGYQNNGGYLNQKWIAVKSGNNWSFKNARTGNYLAASYEWDRGSSVVASSWKTTWILNSRDQSRNRYSLTLSSVPSLALDLTGSNWANETPVITFQYHGGANQIWEFVLTSRGYLT